MTEWIWITTISAGSGAVGLGGLWVGAAAAGVWATPRRPRRTSFDALVVPGSRVYHDGSASPSFRRRLVRAAGLFAEGFAPRVVVSGAGPGPRPEADVGAEFLQALGVPDPAILREPVSRRTAENAWLTRDLLGHQARVLVVTERWHAPRARLWFRRAFVEVEVIGVDAPFGPTVRAALREVPKVAWQAVVERKSG
jgi:uncharacterized SAM-binding protein YcdF (DUF218 family)